MKIQELRQLSGKADRTLLEKAFAETYKQLKKGQKEEIDQTLRDILEGKENAEGSSKKKTDVSFDVLKQEITVFLENAYAQNYFAPNRVIPKSQRPKWRFLVKKYIKELQKITEKDEHYGDSVKLMTELYLMVCYACDYYLFSTEDPFRSIGWEQPDLFQALVKKTFAGGYTRENISALLLYAASGGLSMEALHLSQETVLLAELKTSDLRYTAIEEAKKLVEEKLGKLNTLGKNDNRRYGLSSTVNELCGVILMLGIALSEPEDGVKYYFDHCIYREKEVTLYCALDLVDFMEEDALWLQVYEYGLKKKIRPRASLAAEYQRRTGEGFPESFPENT